MRILLRAVAITATLLLLACQSAPPPAPQAGAATVGDWTVEQGGYVRVETGIVN